MTSWEQPNQQSEHRRMLTVAIVALLLAMLALCWGVWTLYRLGAFGPKGGSAAAAIASTSAPTPKAATTPTPMRRASMTPVALASTLLPTLEPLRPATAIPTETPTPNSSPAGMADPGEGAYGVEYLGCIKHGSGTGTVKGRVFDRQGNIVVGAEVRITLNDWTYDTPGRTNTDGWYEFYLDKGLKVKIVSLRIQGQEMPLVGHEDLVVKSQGGCYENVNLRQR
jgi:hypothetical protein